MAATSEYRVGSHPPPNRSVCAIGQRPRRSAQTSGARWAYSGSRCEKSVVQSDTGPTTGSTRVPSDGSRGTGWKSSAERSSTVISVLHQLDGCLGAVGLGEAGVVLSAGRHLPVTDDGAVALLVLAEEVRREVVAAAVALTAFAIDQHSHVAAPRGGARAGTRRARKAAHSCSSTSSRSGATRAVPTARDRQKCATAAGGSAGSSSPASWARRTRSASQSTRSAT